MHKNVPIKKYGKKMEYSYTLGAFPTIELLKNKPEKVIRVIFHPDINSEKQMDIIRNLCEKNRIPYDISPNPVEKLRDKENCFVIALFEKYCCKLDFSRSHIVLVNPSDSGNMGTILRTCIGFGITNLSIIEPAVDLFHPKVIRASMGALFHSNFTYYKSFEEYYERSAFNRTFYSFMLKGATPLQDLKKTQGEVFSLIFGNEATGLPDQFLEYGPSVCIRHSKDIDSLNLSVALGIGLYEFMK